MISRRTIFSVTTVLTLSLAGCSTEREKPVNSLGDVLTNLAPKASAFEIDPAAEAVLTGEKGTVVYVPADAFQFADGTSPTGKVSIELKECFSLADMIGENMSTTSAGRILETGGMVYFQASADGKQLSLKDKKAFVVGFPKGSQTKEMDLFYNFRFNDTLATWIPDYSMYETEALKASRTDSSRSEYDDYGVTPQYPIEMTDDLFDYKLNVDGFTSSMYVAEEFFERNIAFFEHFGDSTVIADSVARKFEKNGWHMHFEFGIDSQGKVVKLRFSDEYLKHDKYNAYALKVIKACLENAPAFDLSAGSGNINHDGGNYINIAGRKYLNEGRFKKRFREQYASYTTQAIQKIDKDALDYYMFAATNMGWINCDRFWEVKDPKIDFIVKTKTPGEARVQLVFKDINSIMQGKYKNGQFVFENVPLGRTVKVIGINYANGKPSMATAETTVNKDGFELNTFKEFTLDELERELNAPKK